MRKYGEAGWSKIQEQHPEVHIKNGSIRGFCRNHNAVFLGIPYGENCDGEGRFKAPKPVGDWLGVRDCTQYGTIAMQEQMDTAILPEQMKNVIKEYSDVFTGGIPFDKLQEKPGENCLCLNVVTPGIDSKSRPVWVYIHGGGYMSGSGGVTSAISDRLLDEEDLVLITVNHRLNVFGALYLGELDEEYRESGIVTQLDLLLALRWIRENIGVFGGDPNNVTLIGESGGGMKIHHLLAMPESKGLFERAIVISGSIPVAAKSPKEGMAETDIVLKKLGLERKDWRELLTLPAAKLLSATQGMELILPDGTPFMPTADGIRMPYNPDGIYRVCHETADIPVIIGSSEEELASNILNPLLTWEALREQLLKKENSLLSTMPGLNETNVDEVISIFREACGDSKQPWQILAHITSVAHFLGGGGYLASIARAQVGAPTWHYTTTYDTTLPGTGILTCAWHTADLPLAFRAVYHREAEELSKTIAHSFAAFARHGSPETVGQQWPMFTLEGKETMLFDERSEWKSEPFREIYAIMKKICPAFE